MILRSRGKYLTVYELVGSLGSQTPRWAERAQPSTKTYCIFTLLLNLHLGCGTTVLILIAVSEIAKKTFEEIIENCHKEFYCPLPVLRKCITV